MACKRSAVRSRLAPPRFALRATRGAATQEPEGRSVPGVALLGEDGLTAYQIRPRNITSHVASLRGCACGISDIVKRRSIRVWDLQSNLQVLTHNLQVVSALVHRKMREL